MQGITFRDKHNYRDMGVVVRTQSRPLIPPVRMVEETIPYIDGSIDFSEQNGRLYYDDKVLELEIAALGYSSRDLHVIMSRLIGWLSGGFGVLVFDDMPLVRWFAKPVDIKGLVPETFGRTGRTTVQFRCRPFNEFVHGSDGVPLGSDMLLDSNLPLDYGADCEHTLYSGSSVIKNIVYEYIGTAPVAPKIRLSGSGSGNLALGCNGDTIKYTGSHINFVMDCKEQTCINNGSDVSDSVTGDYFEFLPGRNELSVSYTSGSTITLYIEFNPNFLYGDEF